jgi:hypothetical protein
MFDDAGQFWALLVSHPKSEIHSVHGQLSPDVRIIAGAGRPEDPNLNFNHGLGKIPRPIHVYAVFQRHEVTE